MIVTLLKSIMVVCWISDQPINCRQGIVIYCGIWEHLSAWSVAVTFEIWFLWTDGVDLHIVPHFMPSYVSQLHETCTQSIWWHYFGHVTLRGISTFELFCQILSIFVTFTSRPGMSPRVLQYHSPCCKAMFECVLKVKVIGGPTVLWLWLKYMSTVWRSDFGWNLRVWRWF